MAIRPNNTATAVDGDEEMSRWMRCPKEIWHYIRFEHPLHRVTRAPVAFNCLTTRVTVTGINALESSTETILSLSVCPTFCWWQLRDNFFFFFHFLLFALFFIVTYFRCFKNNQCVANSARFVDGYVDKWCFSHYLLYGVTLKRMKEIYPQRLIVRTAQDKWPSGKITKNPHI